MTNDQCPTAAALKKNVIKCYLVEYEYGRRDSMLPRGRGYIAQ